VSLVYSENLIGAASTNDATVVTNIDDISHREVYLRVNSLAKFGTKGKFDGFVT